jgi:hypothetical protein
MSRWNSRSIVGYHGTSAFALEKALDAGFFIGAREPMFGALIECCRRVGDTYFFPVAQRSDLVGAHQKESLVGAYQGAKGYARTVARRHFFTHALFGNFDDTLETVDGFSISDLFSDFEPRISFSDQPESVRKVVSIIPEKPARILRLIQESKLQKGVVIGFTDRVVSCDPLPGDDGADIRAQKIPIQAIAYVSPQDSFSQNYLAR